MGEVIAVDFQARQVYDRYTDDRASVVLEDIVLPSYEPLLSGNGATQALMELQRVKSELEAMLIANDSTLTSREQQQFTQHVFAIIQPYL